MIPFFVGWVVDYSLYPFSFLLLHRSSSRSKELEAGQYLSSFMNHRLWKSSSIETEIKLFRDRKVVHAEHDRPPQKRSSSDGMKTVDPPEEVYQQEATPLGQQDGTGCSYPSVFPS